MPAVHRGDTNEDVSHHGNEGFRDCTWWIVWRPGLCSSLPRNASLCSLNTKMMKRLGSKCLTLWPMSNFIINLFFNNFPLIPKKFSSHSPYTPTLPTSSLQVSIQLPHLFVLFLSLFSGLLGFTSPPHTHTPPWECS